MKNLLTLAAASLIGMAGVTASASMVARNIETAAKKWFENKRNILNASQTPTNNLPARGGAAFGFQPIPASDAGTSANRRPPSSAAGTKEREMTMKNLIKLAAASLIGMSGLTASAMTAAKNIAEAGK